MPTTAAKSSRVSARYGHARRDQREELVLAPFSRADLGDDLLRQHVERLLRDREAVELAAADASSSAAHSTSSSRESGNSRPLGVPPTAWPGAADALQEAGDRARRAELADEVDVADVDAELERGGRDQRLELAALEPLLGVEPLLLGEAAVVRGHALFAEPLGQLAASPARPCAAC